MNRNEAKGILSVYKDRLARTKSFYHHFAAFATTFGATFGLSFLADGPLFLITLMLWGPLVVYHGNRVFGWMGKKNFLWEEEVLMELMDGTRLDELPERLRRHAMTMGASTDEAQLQALQLKRRLENLEAIVTSKDWDALEAEFKSSESAREAALLAERVK